jgi:hypothetical protein
MVCMMGPIQIKDTRTRQLSVKLKFVVLCELFLWLPCQPFGFSEQLLSPPFGALGSA